MKVGKAKGLNTIRPDIFVERSAGHLSLTTVGSFDL